jgi:hypothetical protein
MLDVTLTTAQRHRALAIHPLLADDGPPLPYLLLADALAAGTLRIGEVGDGTVPALLASNKGYADVLVLDGEQLIGARQNRMTNRSILLAAGADTVIPVACVEQGRWRHESDDMRPAPQHSPAKVRRRVREAEARDAMAGHAVSEGVLAGAQGAVWAAVAETLEHVGGASPTGALAGAFDANARLLDEWAAAFPALPGQVGLLAFVGDEPLGLDVVGDPRLYAALHERLLRGYLLDALERPGHAGGGPGGQGGPGGRGGSSGSRPRGEEPGAAQGAAAAASGDDAAAKRYLAAVHGATRTPTPTVGRGSYRVLSGAVIGGELAADERLVHLAAFPAESRPSTGSGGGNVVYRQPLAPPSRRHRPSAG